MQTVGVTHIVTVTPDPRVVPPNVYRQHHIPIEDKSHVSISDHFDASYAFIDEAAESGGKVWVVGHCVLPLELGMV